MKQRAIHPLEEAARAITDGRPVDWEALEQTHPDLKGSIGRLRQLQTLADAALVSSSGSRPESLSQDGPAGLFRWGPLRALERIGEGSFGEVFRAFDPVLRREVALKLRRKRSRRATEYLSHLEEARRLARVRHPNVLTVYGVEVHDGRAGIWTDFIHGRTLEDRLRTEGPLPAADLASIVLDLCRAVAAVHAAGLVHGDIKAANVMLERDGRLVLMDFGAGSAIRRTPRRADSGPLSAETAEASPGEDSDPADRPARTVTVGTPLVMAPELLQGGEGTVRSDLYAVGVLCYRLASGRYPIEARTRPQLMRRHRDREIAPLGELRPDLPSLYAETVMRALEADPAARFHHAAEMEEALAAALEGTEGGERRREERSGAPRSIPAGLPHPGTNFIGRAQERAAIRQDLVRHRLVTLIGPAGCGKSRLALEVAIDAAPGFADGVYWVDLAPLSSDARVASSVLRALGQAESKERADVDLLLDLLEPSHRLVVLDNCEHLVPAMEDLARRIVDRCVHVRLLATSRERLGARGERIIPVSPLDLPVAPREGAAEDPGIAEHAAVRLFVDRAHRARPGFRLTAANAAAVARICRRLDGIPLALELAAARVRSLSVEELASRLEQSIGLASASEDAGISSHRTLEAAVSFSHDLLSPAEQVLWRRLSTFAGTFALVDAERVCADEPGAESAHTVLGIPIVEALARLVDQSMVEVFLPIDAAPASSEGAGARYRLLEMMRETARDRLRRAGETGLVDRRHGDHFLALTRESMPGLLGAQQDAWIARLEQAHDNIRAALERALRSGGDPAFGLELALVARRFWFVRGYLREGIEFFTRLLEARPERDRLRGRALIGASSLAWQLGRLSAAEAMCLDAAVILEEAGDEEGLATVHGTLGTLLSGGERLEEARAHLEQALTLRRRMGGALAIPVLLTNLGVVAGRQGLGDEAERYYREALTLFRQAGDLANAAGALGNLAVCARERNDLAAARRHADEAISLLRGTGDRFALARALGTLADTCRAEGRLAEARAHYLEELQHLRQMQSEGDMVRALSRFVRLCLDERRPREAAVLHGAVEVQRGARGLAAPPAVREEEERILGQLRENLGERPLAAALAEGRAMTLDSAVRFAAE